MKAKNRLHSNAPLDVRLPEDLLDGQVNPITRDSPFRVCTSRCSSLDAVHVATKRPGEVRMLQRATEIRASALATAAS